MSTGAKIHLSKLERELINNKEWILTKHAIITKIFELFGNINNIYRHISKEEEVSFPGFDREVNGKISRGENYQGLPYVMLDYPAFFSKENIFAIRTMFWWGNFFSVTLHLSGTQCRLTTDVPRNFYYLAANDFFVCINEKEWEHNFDLSNYIPAKDAGFSLQQIILSKNFFKISKKLGLDNWEETPSFLEQSFREIIRFVKINFPGGEKALSPGFPKADFGL